MAVKSDIGRAANYQWNILNDITVKTFDTHKEAKDYLSQLLVLDELALSEKISRI
jgi:hypothetical protein